MTLSPAANPPEDHQQPWLHELEISVHGNETCLSDGNGALGAKGTGFFADDRRVLSVLSLTCDGVVPSTVAARNGQRAGFADDWPSTRR